MTGSWAAMWRTHVGLILAVALLSFVFNQAPHAFSDKPYSIGRDGDSGFHVAIQMRLRDPELFPKDIELNEMYLHSRPAFEFTIHRSVIWLADHAFGGNLFTANIAGFWTYHLVFMVGCYLLGLEVAGSPGSAALFAAVSVGLSRAVLAWWGMIFAAVIPHDIGMVFVPWFLLGYLRWLKQPCKLVALFFVLGFTVNVYPLQPTFLAMILLAVTFMHRRSPLSQLFRIGIAFVIGALPSILTSARGTLDKMAALDPVEQGVVDALFTRHYSPLLLMSLRRTAGAIVVSPVWWFLLLAAVALRVKQVRTGLHEMDRRLGTFTVCATGLASAGLVIGAIYRPAVTFFFHRASAFLYIPAYLACAWLATYCLHSGTRINQAVGVMVALLMLFNGAQNTSLFHQLRGMHPMQSSTPSYELADWAAETTSVDSLLMVPFGPRNRSYHAFRVYSARGVLLHWATGEIALSDPSTSTRFWDMANDIEPLYEQESSTADFVRVAHKYGVDYVIADRATPSPPDLPIAYRNEAYTVFAVPPEWP